MRDPATGGDRGGSLELDVVGPEVVEEPPALAEQDGDQMDLQFI